MSNVKISIEELKNGDVIARDVYTENSNIALVNEGAIVNDIIKESFINVNINEVLIYKSDDVDIHDIKKDEFKENYKEKVSDIKDIFKSVLNGEKIDLEKVSTISDNIFESADDIYTSIESISELKDFDDYTYIHSINVSLYSMLIAKWLNLDDNTTRDLVKSAILHDIGKAKVPDMILNKPGELTEEEFIVMKNHPQYGYDLCKDMSDINENIKQGILSHHEKMDGSGYPNGLKGDEISLFPRIIAICDIYDAITSKRVYKNKITPFETFEEMRKIGYDKLDLDIMLTFFNNIGNLYVGLNVEMNTGEIGEIIYIPSQNMSKPLIKIGEKFIDLSSDNNYKIKQIV